MTDFLFVSTAGWILAGVFLLSLFFCGGWAFIGWSRRFERAEREAAGYRNEVAAAHADVERLRRERDVLDRATDIFICASAQLERERQERERDSG